MNHDYCLAYRPEAELVIGRTIGLDADQVLDVVRHWLENGASAVRR